MPDSKAIAATLFTLSVVGAAVVWSLDERNQVGFAMRDASGRPVRAPIPRRQAPEQPNRVLLAVDALLAESGEGLRTARFGELLPDWSAKQEGYGGEQCTRVDTAWLDAQHLRLWLVLGPWYQGESFRFDVAVGAATSTELEVVAHWYSDLGPAIDIHEETGKPLSVPDSRVNGVEGVLTLKTTAFVAGARVPFHFEASSASHDTRWEARGVFELP